MSWLLNYICVYLCTNYLLYFCQFHCLRAPVWLYVSEVFVCHAVWEGETQRSTISNQFYSHNHLPSPPKNVYGQFRRSLVKINWNRFLVEKCEHRNRFSSGQSNGKEIYKTFFFGIDKQKLKSISHALFPNKKGKFARKIVLSERWYRRLWWKWMQTNSPGTTNNRNQQKKTEIILQTISRSLSALRTVWSGNK